MRRAPDVVVTPLLIVVALALPGCHVRTKQEQYVLDQAEDLVQRADRSRQKTTIEVASLDKEKVSICGYVTIGDRRHLPYIIRFSNPIPHQRLATVDVVLDRPKFKGAPFESKAAQSARILAECTAIGHKLPPPPS